MYNGRLLVCCCFLFLCSHQTRLVKEGPVIARPSSFISCPFRAQSFPFPLSDNRPELFFSSVFGAEAGAVFSSDFGAGAGSDFSSVFGAGAGAGFSSVFGAGAGAGSSSSRSSVAKKSSPSSSCAARSSSVIILSEGLKRDDSPCASSVESVAALESGESDESGASLEAAVP